MQGLSSYDGLISLRIMSSGFVHVVACVRISFLLRLSDIPVYVCIGHTLPIYSSADGHPCCFYTSAIVSSAALNVRVPVSL